MWVDALLVIAIVANAWFVWEDPTRWLNAVAVGAVAMALFARLLVFE